MSNVRLRVRIVMAGGGGVGGISACRNFFHLMLTFNFSHLTLHEFFSHPPITFLLVRPLEILINHIFSDYFGTITCHIGGSFNVWKFFWLA